MDRVFLDPNVLFSAAYRANAGIARLRTLSDTTLITSEYAIEETRRNLSAEDQRQRLDQLIRVMEIVVDAAIKSDVRVDMELPAKDWPIALAAAAAHATHLLTGDRRHFGPYFGRHVAGFQIFLPADYLRGR